MAYADRRAGLRLDLPQDWTLLTEDIFIPFTSSAFPPGHDEYYEDRPRMGQGREIGLWAEAAGEDQPMPLFSAFPGAHDPLRSFPVPAYRSHWRRAREEAEERALWDEVLGHESHQVQDDERGWKEPLFPEDPEADEREAYEHDEAVVFLGLWEGFYVEPPDEDGDLLPGAAWLASSCGEFLWFFPRHDSLRRSHGLDCSQRRVTIGGRPAASVAYRYLGGQDGETAAELRLVAIQLPDGRVSFALGLAHSNEHCGLIDDILDSLQPL